MGADAGHRARVTRAPDAQALVREIVLRIDVDELAHRMVEEFYRSIDSYRRMSPSVVATQIQDVVRENLPLFIACALDVRAPLEAELAPFRESARDRARGHPAGRPARRLPPRRAHELAGGWPSRSSRPSSAAW